MKVGLFMIATGKYKSFIEPLVRSVEKHFLKNHEVQCCVFTDSVKDVCEIKGIKHIGFARHEPWPGVTLHRCHTFLAHKAFFNTSENKFDYIFYIDVDTLIVNDINDDILQDSVAVQHCGFVGKRGSYETRPESTSYVAPEEQGEYFGGGFWGFSNENFWHWVWAAVGMINTDSEKGIIPVWHDESVLNRYLMDNPPTKILSPSYHYPEKADRYLERWPERYQPKIMLLEKNHDELRKEETC